MILKKGGLRSKLLVKSFDRLHYQYAGEAVY